MSGPKSLTSFLLGVEEVVECFRLRFGGRGFLVALTVIFLLAALRKEVRRGVGTFNGGLRPLGPGTAGSASDMTWG